MSACEVEVKSDFSIDQQNPLEEIANLLESMVEEQRQDSLELVRDLRDAIVRIRQLSRRPVVSWRFPNPAENVLFNLWLDYLLGEIGDLETRLEELEQKVAAAADGARAFFEGAGNPQALTDTARLLREGVAELSENLANEVTLAKLSVDNRWQSTAASAYAENAEQQRLEGLEVLAAAAESLAVFLDEHSATEVDFWDKVGDMIGQFVLVAVGLAISALGVAASIAGLVLAIPTGGIGLVVSIAGLILSALGLVMSLIGVWSFMDELRELIPAADSTLASGLETMQAAAVDAGEPWPLLAQ